jgi:hypothetical protein
MNFSAAGVNPQDNETTLIRKMVQYTYDWATAEGKTSLQEPDAGDNTTTLWRKMENNLYQLARDL